MLFEYVFVYLMIDVFCLAFSIVIFTKINIDMGTEREVNALRGLTVAYMAFLVIDAIWAMGTYDSWLMTRAATGIFEAMTLLLMGIVAFCWFLYVEFRLGSPYAQHRRFVVLSAIPVFIIILMYATTRFTGLIYTIGPDATFVEGPLALLPDVVFLLYVVVATIHAVIRFVRERSSIRRFEIAPLMWFAIPPVACGILDIFLHGMPVMALSTFASVLLVFMSSQDSRINTDALTGLNNRRRAMQYIEDSVAGISEGTLFGVFMIDVDYFKDINDKRGHGEGDHALQLIAEGLRRAMDGHHGLAARWGGDEFLVATFLNAAENPVDLEEGIQRAIDAVCERSGVGYNVSVSMGYALAERDEAISDLVAEADRMLYEQKAEHHAALKHAR
ncbi:MAG: GGDEF domain-containing protein [Eggerthellaceae bacterium]|nr:GGDEF domain-containing protein [Eggerthellaceae bacterium]